MELKEFITETLSQIAEGVKEAGVKYNELGGMAPYYDERPIYGGGKYIEDKVVDVEFEVALTNTSKDGGKAGIGVALSVVRAGVDKSKSTEEESLTRVKFSVPISLPRSDK